MMRVMGVASRETVYTSLRDLGQVAHIGKDQANVHMMISIKLDRAIIK